jgi:hypothetical protein
MLRLKEGECVRIVDRPATAADLKSGLFYNHYRNLAGTVFKLYGTGETQQAAIDVLQESLPAELAERHEELTTQLRSGLSGAARRNSGPGGEQEFRLRYVVLVAVSDLARRKS